MAPPSPDFSPAFWQTYAHLVLCSADGRIALTRKGRTVLGAQLSAAGLALRFPMALPRFLAAMEIAQASSHIYEADLAAATDLPAGSPERALLESALGVHPGLPSCAAALAGPAPRGAATA